MSRLWCGLCCCVVVICTLACHQHRAHAQAPEDKPYLRASDEDLEWWREARFGLFIHWGPVSLRGTEIGWSRGTQIPTDEYDSLYKQFNPVDFNADEWVALAKAAGMRYLVFTSKHHDGFSMFDTALSDYKITNSPFGRDVVGELAAACQRAGLRLGFYYSPPDWHHPDYRTANHGRYVEYLHGQLREICSNYGKIDIIWFDGLDGTAAEWDSERLLEMIRSLQPGVLINNRAGLPADFDTPEQTIGRYQVDRPWESCITMGQQWAWRPNDVIKSFNECIATLVRCAGGDGNLLFNVGPMPNGEIEHRQQVRLRQMGAWLSRYGESIYGTRGGPFRPGKWGAATCKGNRVYLHMLSPEPGPLRLPPLRARIAASRVLTGGTVKVNQAPDGIEVLVPVWDRKDPDTIVVLELDRPAFTARLRRLASGSVAFGRPATASNVYLGMEAHRPALAVDDNPDTRWATDYGVHSAQLELDLGSEMEIGRVAISEEYGRIRAFEVQYRAGDEWRTCLAGTTVGPDYSASFEPVRAQHVRLNITEAIEGPTIWEFQLFAPER